MRFVRIILVLAVVWGLVAALGFAMLDQIGASAELRRAYLIASAISVSAWGLWRAFLRPRVDKVIASDNRRRVRGAVD